MALLEVENLSVSFRRYTGRYRGETVTALDRLSLTVDGGELLAVVGASGSGKTLLARALIGILPDNALVTGTIRYQGRLLDAQTWDDVRWREIALVPQSVTFLDPLMQAGAQVRHAVRTGDPVAQQRDAFRRFRLDTAVERLYPFQLSGGTTRKILLAMAAVSGARLLVADEPTTGVDPETIHETLLYLRKLADQGRAVLCISHDIAAILRVAHRVAVFYAGTIVEIAPAGDFDGQGEKLRHPYSRALWRALPQNDFAPPANYRPHPSELPNERGCAYAAHCPHATTACQSEKPDFRRLRDGFVRCHHAT